MEEQRHQKSGLLLVCCLTKHQGLPPPCPCSPPGLGHLCIPPSGLLPGDGHPTSSAALWCGASGVWPFTWLRLGCTATRSWETRQRLGQTCLCSASGVSQHVCAPHKWSPGLHSFSLSPSDSPSQPEGAFLPQGGPQEWDAQSGVLTAHSPGWVSSCVTFLFF